MQPDHNHHITNYVNKVIEHFSSEGHAPKIMLLIPEKPDAVKVANALRKLHFSCFIQSEGSYYSLTVNKP